MRLTGPRRFGLWLFMAGRFLDAWEQRRSATIE